MVRPRHRGNLIAACQCLDQDQGQGIPTATSLVVPRRRMHGTTRPRPPVTGLARSPGVEAFALSRPRPASPTACRCRTRSRAPSGFLPPSARHGQRRAHFREARTQPRRERDAGAGRAPGPGVWNRSSIRQVGSVRHGRERRGAGSSRPVLTRAAKAGVAGPARHAGLVPAP